MSRDQDLLELYNDLSKLLQEHTGLDSIRSFHMLVQEAAKSISVVRRHAKFLKDCGDVRNLIAHQRQYRSQVMVEPSRSAVERLQEIISEVGRPAGIYELFSRDLRIFSPSEAIADAIAYMRKNDFSQIVVERKDRFNLLTTEHIAAWLGDQASEDIISIQEARVGDALESVREDFAAYLGRDCHVGHARSVFASVVKNRQPRVFAILITENGKANERPLGIVTPWDLLSRRTGVTREPARNKRHSERP